MNKTSIVAITIFATVLFVLVLGLTFDTGRLYGRHVGDEAVQWAWWSAAAAVVGLPLSLAGIVAVLLSLRKTDHGLDLARKANALSKSAQDREFRPILVFDSWVPQELYKTADMEKTYKLEFHPVWKNVGRTPATIISSTLKYAYIRGAAKNHDVEATMALLNGFSKKDALIIVPEGTYSGAIALISQHELDVVENQKELWQVVGRYLAENLILLIATVHYREALGNNEPTEFWSRRVQAISPQIDDQGLTGGFWDSPVGTYPMNEMV